MEIYVLRMPPTCRETRHAVVKRLRHAVEKRREPAMQLESGGARMPRAPREWLASTYVLALLGNVERRRQTT